MYSRNKAQGFTLVEIAIVLVIVGLLLGGILKGQEMIVQAKIKNAIADFSGVSAAYHGYLDRYRQVPGDDAGAGGASGRWGAAAVSGNGNRVLEGTYQSTTADAETRLWWDHLRRSGFVAGSGQNQPNNAFNGVLGVQTGDGAATPANALGMLPVLVMCSTNMPDKVAIAVDVQMDDGDARNGFVRAQVGAGSPALGNAAPTDNYVENGTNVYTLCRSF